MSSRTGETGSLWQARVSVLDHQRNALGIMPWGRRLTKEALQAIGISRNRVPVPSVRCEHLHYARDVTDREDQARTNAGHAPRVLAALRNTVPTMLRRLGFRPVEGLEHIAEHRQEAIEAIYGRGTE
jgi:hypothetical protein